MIQLFNTLTRKEEPFAPSSITSCACTHAAPRCMRAHIGNFRHTYASMCCAARSSMSGYEVREAINYTDVDDKTIAGANEAGVPLREYTEQWIEAFRDDALVGDRGAGETPRATDEQNLRAMGDMILALEHNGHTYRRDGSIYFRIASFPSMAVWPGWTERGCRTAPAWTWTSI